MNSITVLKISLLVLLGGAGMGVLAALHVSNAKLSARLSQLRIQSLQLKQQREDDERVRQLVEKVRAGEASAVRAIQEEIAQTRQEVAEREKRAEMQHAQKAAQLTAKAAQANADSQVAAVNLDPEKGPARIDVFQNVGRATPSASFQTLVWAAVQGDDDALAAGISMSDFARARAAAVIAALPEDLRKMYPTPERLVVPFLANALLSNAEALQISGQTMEDAQHGTVSVRPAGQANAKMLPMQLGPSGWQWIVPDQAIDELQRMLLGSASLQPAGE